MNLLFLKNLRISVLPFSVFFPSLRISVKVCKGHILSLDYRYIFCYVFYLLIHKSFYITVKNQFLWDILCAGSINNVCAQFLTGAQFIFGFLRFLILPKFLMHTKPSEKVTITMAVTRKMWRAYCHTM